MDKDELIQRLMATFLGELEEHVSSLNRDLLALEKQPIGDSRGELLKTLFRTAHSLKGASRSVSVEPIEAACHRLEGMFADVRDGLLPLAPDLFQLLFATVDGIEETGRLLRETRDPSGSVLPGPLPRLDSIRRTVAPPVSVESPVMAAPSRASRPAVPSTPAAAAGTGNVRIPAAKLDALLAASGELLVARRRLEPRAEELAALTQFVARWKEEWRPIERPLRRALGNGARPNGSSLSRKAMRVLGQVAENLDRAEHGLEALIAGLAADRQALERAAGPLDEEVRRVRMLPFAEACEGLERAARDIARAGGKNVDLAVEGADLALDRSILEALKDPLLHLVRNAVAHGIETPAVRTAAGKPARGRVRVAAALQGDRVRIVVADDGAGLDVAAIGRTAARRKLAEPANEREAAQLLFLPGFSTTRMVTEVSGRGVGLDVVKSRVEALHGSAVCEPEPGGGLAVVLELPLTVTTIRALLLSAGGQIYALPHTHISALLRVGVDDLRSIEGREVVTLGDTPVPIVSLAQLLGTQAREAPSAGAKLPAVVLAVGEQRAAVSVDELLAEQEVVVTGLGRRIRRAHHFSGATILPSGRIALILSAGDVIRSALACSTGRPLTEQLAAGPVESKRLLVVDDSVTTRSLVKSILEAAGYAVWAAADGAEAWQVLQERGADLVVSDVEMPRVDGFDLTTMIRRSQRFRKLPVVLVTALESAEDKARGMEVGADAYLAKSGFDQRQLLETIAQLV